eukprot:5452819-Prymnesium_polylepis.1
MATSWPAVRGSSETAGCDPSGSKASGWPGGTTLPRGHEWLEGERLAGGRHAGTWTGVVRRRAAGRGAPRCHVDRT